MTGLLPTPRRTFRAAALVALALAVGGCAASQGEKPQTSRGEKLRTVLREVRENPENRAASEVYCLLSIAQGKSDFPYQLFFAGLFAVDKEAGARAFCAAMIEAVIAGELTETDLSHFDKPSSTRGKEPLGTLLRKLMVAHLRLETQEAGIDPSGGSKPAS